MGSSLRFFYFDLGNVLLHFSHDRAAQQMADVAGISKESVWEAVFASNLEWQYEAGEISTEEFYEIFCQQTGSTPDLASLRRAGADIFELNVSIVPVVAGLRSVGARLGILSNTNEAHWNFVSADRYRLFPGYFEQVALSYEIKAMKPHPAIYEAAISLTGVDASEVFFVDDRPENVAGAKASGIDAVQFTTASQLVRDLLQRGVRFNI